MIKLGITGGIGSGKSTITQMFRVIGVPVYVSDERSKYLSQTNSEIIAGLKQILGDDIYDEMGRLDRKRMASVIFADKEKLQKVNALIHPIVNRDFIEWTEEQKSKGVPYVVNEAAIMIESGSHKLMDKLLVVTAPVEQRVERVMKRDGVGEQQVKSRINNQMSDKEKVEIADYVIVTDDHHFIMPEILALDEELRRLA
ncbi:MAG: dephospho-CoA kinase [Bacteroidales bacterium]|nr:dephospho-CoA kinase [Bacteroidales bacterium]